MGMPHPTAPWTVDRVRALPDDGHRHEVVDGELLVTPAPNRRHQRAVLSLMRRLDPYLQQHQYGELVVSPADIELDPWTLVQPDVFVAPWVERAPDAEWRDGAGDLLLAIEILSPGSARADRHLKRRRYQRAGIPEYWIVDLDARLVERWRPGDERPEILAERLEWRPVDGLPGLVIELGPMFAEVWR